MAQAEAFTNGIESPAADAYTSSKEQNEQAQPSTKPCFLKGTQTDSDRPSTMSWTSPQVFQWEGELPKVSHFSPPVDLLPILTGPLEMELLTWTGMIMFLDGLLYCITFLPLKTIAVLWDMCVAYRHKPVSLYPKQLYVLVQAIVIFVATIFVDALTMTEAYGFVVNLSWTRTWVLYTLFDVFDEILTKFGQRTMGSLLWCIKERRSLVPAMTVLWSLILILHCGSIVYVSAHSFAMNLKISTIHIAIDRGNMLFALLLAVKLPELKGGSLMQCTKSSLFRLCLTDTVDRAKCVVFSCVIFLDKSARFPLDRWAEWMPTLFGATCMIFASEVLVDWLKHAGLVMVNSDWLSSTTYADFRRAISQDLIRNTQDDSTGLADCTLSVLSDNFGFVQLPLTCVILNMVLTMELQAFETGRLHTTSIITVFAVLFALKLVTHHFLLSLAISTPLTRLEKTSSLEDVRGEAVSCRTSPAHSSDLANDSGRAYTPVDHNNGQCTPIRSGSPAGSPIDHLRGLADASVSTDSVSRRRSSSDGSTRRHSTSFSEARASVQHSDMESLNHLRKTSSLTNIEDARSGFSERKQYGAKSLSMPEKLNRKPRQVHDIANGRAYRNKSRGAHLSLSSIVLDVLAERDSTWSESESPEDAEL